MTTPVTAPAWCGPAVVTAPGFRPCEHDRLRAWELWEAAHDGDRAAFGGLWERYVPAVRAVVRGWVRDDATAEDVTSATFLKLLGQCDTANGKRARDQGEVLSLLLWLARRMMASQVDRACVRREVAVGEFDPDQLTDHRNPERVVLGRFDQDAVTAAVHGAVAELPASQRAMVQMCDLDERAASEVAAATGRSEKTVRELRSRGRRALATALAPWAPPTRERVVALARYAERFAPPQSMPPAEVQVATTIERRTTRFRARLRWTDPVTGARRSLSHSCAQFGEAEAWLSHLLTQRTAAVARPAAPDQFDAVESDAGWLVAA